MRLSKAPIFHSDRDHITVLEAQASETLAAMQKWDVGRVFDGDRVSFCGLIHHPERGAYVFLPRPAKVESDVDNLTVATLMMKALARFGAETTKRKLEADGESGNPSALSVIRRLSDDFRDRGIFAERARSKTRNSGKPDWLRTLKRETTMPDRKGRPVFTDIRTSRPVSNNDVLLAQIQAAVMREIFAAHSWWLGGGSIGKHQLNACPRPPFPRELWARKLDALMPSLYSARALFLAAYLKHYLKETRASSDGTFIFGVNDFHTVWETILRETLVRSPADTLKNWNEILPKPVYIRNDGAAPEKRSRGMITDIILENDNNFIIVDAKYYAAQSAETAPGWPDIAKQMFYENALREVLKRTAVAPVEIRSVFVFPSRTNEGPLARVVMQHLDGTPLSTDFPSILCAYVSISGALESYVSGAKHINL